MEDNHPLRPLEDNETLGIVFPVYAWGVPRIVRTFLRHMTIGSRYVWTVMTCGDDMGHADSILEKTLRRKVDAAFSVGMPNTYVCLPGFETDSPALAQQKVEHTQRQLPLIDTWKPCLGKDLSTTSPLPSVAAHRQIFLGAWPLQCMRPVCRQMSYTRHYLHRRPPHMGPQPLHGLSQMIPLLPPSCHRMGPVHPGETAKRSVFSPYSSRGPLLKETQHFVFTVSITILQIRRILDMQH